jgi:hypothetical protein
VVDREPGSGKSYAAALIAQRCERPLVVAPASVIPQTRKMFAAYGVPTADARDGADPGRPGVATFASYTWLTRAAQAEFFDRFRPTDVLMDEFHECRGLGNSARRRLERHAIGNPRVRFALFSASLVTDRLEDFAFGLLLALRGGVRGLVPPTPAGRAQLQETFDLRPAAWAEFQRRLGETPGVFRDGDGVGSYAGQVVVRVVRREPALRLPDSWELPDGYLLTSASEAAQVSKMLAWGYWPKVTPRPSETYLAARRRWAEVVRGVVATGVVDTDAQVRELRPKEWARFVAAEDAEPRGTETPVWERESVSAIGSAGQAASEAAVSGRPTIVWAYHRALQERAARRLGVPHHGSRGLDAAGVRLDETDAPLVVASIEACHAGFNCQAFNHSLVLEPPSDPEVWRQLIGRTARQGQLSPRVTVDVVVNCAASENSLRTAIARAKVIGKKNPILQLDGTDW